MKFLRWLFNINKRHSREIREYENGKIGNRIFSIFFLLLLVGGAIGLEYWCINLFNNGVFLNGLLVLIFLVIPFMAITFEYCELYAYLGFKMFIWGSVSSIAEKIDKKIEKNRLENGEIVVETKKQTKSEKAHKWLDLFIAILAVALAIVLLVMIFVLLANNQ